MPKLVGVLLDTNACLYLLKKQVDPSVEIEGGLVSVVTEIELLGYPEITKPDEELIREFLEGFARSCRRGRPFVGDSVAEAVPASTRRRLDLRRRPRQRRHACLARQGSSENQGASGGRTSADWLNQGYRPQRPGVNPATGSFRHHHLAE